jgi:hypothetical protein
MPPHKWWATTDEFSGRIRIPAIDGVLLRPEWRLASGYPTNLDGGFVTELGQFTVIEPRLIETATGDLYMATWWGRILSHPGWCDDRLVEQVLPVVHDGLFPHLSWTGRGLVQRIQEHRAGGQWAAWTYGLDDPPWRHGGEGAGVREPRRPAPTLAEGSIALDLPPDPN